MPSRGDPSDSLDRQVLARLLRTLGTPQEFHAMLRDFLVGTDLLLADLERALEAGRLPELERSAHTLKSMAHLVGAHGLEAECRALEQAARASQPLGLEQVAGISERVHDAQGAVARLLP